MCVKHVDALTPEKEEKTTHTIQREIRKDKKKKLDAKKEKKHSEKDMPIINTFAAQQRKKKEHLKKNIYKSAFKKMSKKVERFRPVFSCCFIANLFFLNFLAAGRCFGGRRFNLVSLLVQKEPLRTQK